MSATSYPKINQKEYLKKYLSGGKVKKKKKDKKHKSSSAAVKVRIIDDDINHLNTGLEIDEELLLTGDDAPQIVGEYIEEKLCDSKVLKWKSIKDEPDDRVNDKQNESDLWGRKGANVLIKKETRSSRSPDNSPPRKKHRKRKLSSSSPSRRRKSSSSPPRKSKKDKSRKNNESPHRKYQIKEEPQSPPCRKRERRESSTTQIRNPDLSPPRRGKSPSSNRRYSPDQSPPRRKKDPDRSPSRRDKRRSPDQSPPRRRRDSDQSPPRKKTNRDHTTSGRRQDLDQSLSRRGKRNVDQSPPPRKEKSPNRNYRRRSTDESPPRTSKYLPQKSRSQKTLDQSPPRKSRKSRDQSPPRRRRSSDQSPPRNLPSTSSRLKQQKLPPDLSPSPRRSRWRMQDSEKSLSPPPTHKQKPGKTLEGKKAGLQDAHALQKETMERRKQEDLLFEKMSSEVSGRNAEVQVRSTGRKGRRALEASKEDPEEKRRKEEHEEKKKFLYDCWGKGLKQIEDHKNRMLEQEHESSKPLARYSNDEDLESYLKQQERAEDPMLEYMRQKRKEKEKQSGKPQMPRYEGPYPPNRFGIPPGYRWDGVDRSNGYEKKYFAAQNEKLARQDAAYKYSVEDM